MKEQTKHNMIRIAAGLVFLALLIAFVLRAGYAFAPVRQDYGAVWSKYLLEPEDSVDVLYFGTSLAYCDVAPAVIYEETGLTGFVMAGPNQTFSITWSYINEALKTQSPSVICLEVTGLLYERYMPYTVVNIGYMPYFSMNRLEAVRCAAEPEERFGLLFPLYNYHDQWDDPQALFRPRADEAIDPYAGFTPMQTHAAQTRGERKDDPADDVFAENVAYLHRIQTLCAERGIELLLFQAPTCSAIPDAWMARIREAAGPDARFVDFNEQFDAIGLDPETDFYDAGHCSVTGAEKFSRVLGTYLAEACGVQPHAYDAELWRWRVETHHAL